MNAALFRIRGDQAVGMVIFSCVVMAAWIGLRQMRQASDYSAHAALSAEILSNLVFIGYSDQPFPRALSDLPLRFPDGGNASLLRRFEYSVSGTNCTVRTRLPYADRDTVWSF